MAEATEWPQEARRGTKRIQTRTLRESGIGFVLICLISGFLSLVAAEVVRPHQVFSVFCGPSFTVGEEQRVPSATCIVKGVACHPTRYLTDSPLPSIPN